MAVRTPPAHIYTSSATRRERAWARSRRERGARPGQPLQRRPGLRRRVLATIGPSFVVLAVIAAALLIRTG